MNFKLISLTSGTAFALSFFTALISGAGFGRSFIRGLIVAVCFGALSVGIQFLFEKVLNIGTGDASGDNAEPAQAPIGNKVDITIDDEELKEEDGSPKFILTGQNQMLNKEDLKDKNGITENVDVLPSEPEPVAPARTEPVPVSQKESVGAESTPAFKPVPLGQTSDSSTDEFPSIDATLGNASFLNPDANKDEEENIDTLPEMGGSPLRDDTVTDSDFASGGKKTSRLSDPMFPDGSMAESKDSSLMAEAIRTILTKGE